MQVNIDAAFIFGSIGFGIAPAPSRVRGIDAVVLGAREGPHVIDGPDDGFFDPADLLDREEAGGDPVEVDYIGIGSVDVSGAEAPEPGGGAPGVVRGALEAPELAI